MTPALVDVTNRMFRAMLAIIHNTVPADLPELQAEKVQAKYEFGQLYSDTRKEYDELEEYEDTRKKRLKRI